MPDPPRGASGCLSPSWAWINFEGMGQVDDSRPTRTKTATFIHAGPFTSLYVEEMLNLVYGALDVVVGGLITWFAVYVVYRLVHEDR